MIFFKYLIILALDGETKEFKSKCTHKNLQVYKKSLFLTKFSQNCIQVVLDEE